MLLLARLGILFSVRYTNAMLMLLLAHCNHSRLMHTCSSILTAGSAPAGMAVIGKGASGRWQWRHARWLAGHCLQGPPGHHSWGRHLAASGHSWSHTATAAYDGHSLNCSDAGFRSPCHSCGHASCLLSTSDQSSRESLRAQGEPAHGSSHEYIS